jgi:hypothetical protein
MDQIVGGGGLVPRTGSAAAGQALHVGAAHEHLHGVVADEDALTEAQFSVHPTRPVRAA